MVRDPFSISWSLLLRGGRPREIQRHETFTTTPSSASHEIHTVNSSFWKAENGDGIAYDVSDADLRSLQQRRVAGPAVSDPRLLSHTDTYESLKQKLEAPFTAEQLAALQRLRRAFDMGKEQLLPDLFIKVSHDLDLVLFDGMLHDRLRVTWRALPTGVCGSCHRSSRVLRLGKLQIRLNKACFFTDSKEKIWGTLMHQLLHAYVLLTTGRCVKSVLGRPDQAFKVAARRLVSRLGFPGFCVHNLVSKDRDTACVINGSMDNGGMNDIPCDDGLLCAAKKCCGYGLTHGDENFDRMWVH